MDASGRIGGAALIAAGAGIVFAMAHHPTGTHGTGALGPVVHGAMIVLLWLTAFGFAIFCMLRGPGRPLVLAGAISYAVAFFGHLGAGTINGFVVPALAAHSGSLASHDVFRLAWEANQALATLGVIAASVAFLFWSADLLRSDGREAKAVGALGIIAGAVPIGLLLGGLISMNVPGAMIVYAIQAAWGACLALQMVRRRDAMPLERAATTL